MILDLLKFSISTVVLFAFYHFFLSREKTLVFNRFYLLSALLFSFIIPFIQLDFYRAPTLEIPAYAVNTETMNAPDFPVAEQDKAISSTQGLSFFSVLAGLYCIITVLLGIRFFSDLTRLVRRIYASEKIPLAEGTLVLTEAPCFPHSFFRYIFVNKTAYENGHIDPNILKHEATHGRQLHSADVLFIALVQVFFWFNPIVFLYKKVIQLNHEYLADAAVLTGGVNLYDYQKVLLQLISEQSSPALACNFYSSTKKRLLMMTAENQFTRAIKKQLFIIPMLTFLVIGLGCENETLQEISPLESHVERITREKVLNIQTDKTTTSEIKEIFGEPDLIYPLGEVENWHYYIWKDSLKMPLLSITVDTNTKKVYRFGHYRTFEDVQVVIQPEELQKPIFRITNRGTSINPQGVTESLYIRGTPASNLSVNDIKSLYGSPSIIAIDDKKERWEYQSPSSTLRFLFDREEKVHGVEYVYYYVIPHYRMKR